MRDYSKSGHEGYDIAKLVDAGVDPLHVTAEFGKYQGIRVFESIRMNDIHDHSLLKTYGKLMFLHNERSHTHQGWRLRRIRQTAKKGVWAATNFVIPQIQDKLLEFAEQAITLLDDNGPQSCLSGFMAAWRRFHPGSFLDGLESEYL